MGNFKTKFDSCLERITSYSHEGLCHCFGSIRRRPGNLSIEPREFQILQDSNISNNFFKF